jgi:hypothetical protein
VSNRATVVVLPVPGPPATTPNDERKFINDTYRI